MNRWCGAEPQFLVRNIPEPINGLGAAGSLRTAQAPLVSRAAALTAEVMQSLSAPSSISSVIDRTLWPSVAALVGVIALFESTGLDLFFQDFFYDFQQARWLVDSRWRITRLVFHEVPTVITIVVGVAVLIRLFNSRPWQWIERFTLDNRRAIACAVLTIASVPLLVAGGKEATNMFCPYEVQRYGGDVCYVRLFEEQPESDAQRRGKCFPAGHASGPFALIGLFSVLRRRRDRLAALGFGLALGSIAGGYQMLTGAHYVSHTVVSLLLSWIALVGWRRVFGLVHDDVPQRASRRETVFAGADGIRVRGTA